MKSGETGETAEQPFGQEQTARHVGQAAKQQVCEAVKRSGIILYRSTAYLLHGVLHRRRVVKRHLAATSREALKQARGA